MGNEDAMTLAAYALNERRAHDDPWHELATGGLTADQVVALRRDMEPPEEIERKLELFGPTKAETSDRTLDLLLRRYLPPTSKSGPKGPSSDDAPSRRERRWWSNASVAGTVALAAAVLLVWVVRRPEPPEEMPALASFELQFRHGWSGDMRGADDIAGSTQCDEQYHRDHSLSVSLSPTEAFGEETNVAAFARPEVGEARWLALSAQVRNNGVLTIEQPIADLGLTPGTWTLTFYVTRRGQQHNHVLLQNLSPGTHPGVTVVQGSVCIVD